MLYVEKYLVVSKAVVQGKLQFSKVLLFLLFLSILLLPTLEDSGESTSGLF